MHYHCRAPSRDLFATLDDFFASQRTGAMEMFRVRTRLQWMFHPLPKRKLCSNLHSKYEVNPIEIERAPILT